jgi:VIT1/CCC1 family predicted Fe2+/Mn2+ transporter
MAKYQMDQKLLKSALAIQRKEMTEYHIYTALARLCKDPHNAEVLEAVGRAELGHAKFWQEHTAVEAEAQKFRVWRSVALARILGLTFTLKRMEKNEGTASRTYRDLAGDFPMVEKVAEEEAMHERELLSMLDEERLRYAGSVVLGLNDALVELTGALAGFTLALGETKLISLAGLVTGISAAFSMTASAYLSGRADNNARAATSAFYTGAAYIITVAVLILPFLLLPGKFIALGITMLLAVIIILLFNYYLATARDLDFRRRFGEMVLISLGVAVLSFGVGFVLKNVLGAAA